jgi:aminomethyltransferase
VGLKLADKRIPREGFPVLRAGRQVGAVASGTFGLTVQSSIAMAFVEPTCAAIGTELAVEIRGQEAAATVVPLPFYKRNT